MKQKSVPLRGKKLVLFALLFGGFMCFVGYSLRSNDSTDIIKIAEETELKDGLLLFHQSFDHYSKGEYVKAKELLQSAEKRGIKQSAALIGECAYLLGENMQAESWLLRALKVENGEELLPGYYKCVHYNLGRVYHRLNKEPQAVAQFEKALSMGHKDAGIYLDSIKNK